MKLQMSHETIRSITLAGQLSKGPGATDCNPMVITTYPGQFHRRRDVKPPFMEFQFLINSVLNFKQF